MKPKTRNENEVKDLAEVQAVKKAVVPIFKRCMELVVKTDEDLANANKGLTVIKQELDKMEAARKALVDPLNAHVKFINAQFKDPANKLQECKGILEGKMLDYRREQQKKIDEQNKKIAAENARIEAENKKKEAAFEKKIEKAKDPEAVQAPIFSDPKEFKTQEVKVDNSSFKKFWDFEIMDVDKAPLQFKVLDTSLVRKDMNQQVKDGKVPSNPGIRYFQEERIATSRGE